MAKIIGGGSESKPESHRTIGGDRGVPVEVKPASVHTSLRERIAALDLPAGLQELPKNFDDDNGDWTTIKSANPFEVLYLDYRRYKIITPDLVKQHYTLLEKFWQYKISVMMTGGNRKNFEELYGHGVVENSLTTLKRAFEKIRTEEGIQVYYRQINNERLKNGEVKLAPFLKMMLRDNEADPGGIESVLEEGLGFDLRREETAAIIKRAIELRELIPYGTPSGNTLSETLISVSWMLQERIKAEQEKAAQAKKNGREILDNVYAYNVEEIGQILFDNEVKAKRYITDGLLKNSIDYFSSAKAAQFLTIVSTQKNEHLRYLQIIYRLKAKLPYRFNASTLVGSVKELVSVMFATPESFKLGKEQFKLGYVEIWL